MPILSSTTVLFILNVFVYSYHAFFHIILKIISGNLTLSGSDPIMIFMVIILTYKTLGVYNIYFIFSLKTLLLAIMRFILHLKLHFISSNTPSL